MVKGNDHGRRFRLTVFLIKEGYKNVADFLSAEKLHKAVVTSDGIEGTLFFRGGFKSQPPWVSIFEGIPGFNGSLIVNQSSRGLYVIRVDGRWFCFTFGYARHLILEAAIERNFGLIVALNLGDPEAIKALDKTNISHVGLHSREQAGRDVGFDGFEFNTDIDLLKAITAKGPLVDGAEQETYSGRDSITVYTRVTVGTFAHVARKLLKAFQNTAYKSRYPWIDKITEERDSTIIAQLDAALVARINDGERTRIWLAVPEVVAWEEIDGFAFRVPSQDGKKAGPVLYSDIDLDHWLQEVKLKGSVTLKQLESRKIYQCFKDGRDPASWSVYRCVNGEIDLHGRKYILSDGSWYNVDHDYVSEVQGFYAAIPSSTLAFPKYGTDTEPVYLQSLGKSHPQFAIMDRKLVMIGGNRSSVEFCDVFSKSGDIVHVKKYGGSSVLSHLFSQAVVSAECFLHEPVFRERLNDLLPAGFKLVDPAKTPIAKAYTVCVAIMSHVPGPLEIPFFSKVSLKHALKNLQRMGFPVTKLKIER